MRSENVKRWSQGNIKNKAEGVCSVAYCIRVTDGPYKTCSYHRKRGLDNKIRKQKMPKKEGQCRVWSCSNLTLPGLTRCEPCRTREALWAQGTTCKLRRAERRQEVKLEVLTTYGGRCVCCGEDTLAFLTIDHIDRYNGIGPKTGNALYLWLKANSYPEGFRVLCMNCNFALGKFGFCPHGDIIQPFKEREVLERTRKTRDYQRVYHQELKRRAFAAYGGPRCVCCGEIHPECLSIDHINNDGAHHRRQLAGKPIYLWLYENDFPPGFQVLCMNCNISKRDNHGICWHEGGRAHNGA